MPRRNNRHREQYEPLDLTPADVRRPRPEPRHLSHADSQRLREERERQAAERQRNARINKGIDWSICLVPGCGKTLTLFGEIEHRRPEMRDHTIRLPLCIDHLFVAYKQASHPGHRGSREPTRLQVEALALVMEREQARLQANQDEAKRKRLASTNGHIYFVRLNGLVKVGWSRDVAARLRAYGPEVEVLAVYPGTRDDETYLHRQLRPSLKVGREWYEDNAILADYVARAVAEHGEPNVRDDWTRPKEVIRLRRRSA